MPKLNAADQPPAVIPVGFLRKLIRLMLREYRGRSPAHRQRLAAELARLVWDHSAELPDATALMLSEEITQTLNAWSRPERPHAQGSYTFDRRGALCWTATALATTLGFEHRTGLRRLAKLRARGDGPSFIKLADTAQSPALYPIATTMSWLESRRTDTEPELELDLEGLRLREAS